MKVLHCVADIYKQSGGQAYAITSLCGAIARLGHEVTLLVGNYRPLEDLVEVPGNIELVTQPASRYLKGYSPAIKSWLASNAAHADIVHTHGLWNAMSRYAVRVAAGRNKPCVLAPIGMLEPQALMRRRLTKSFFWRVVERPA